MEHPGSSVWSRVVTGAATPVVERRVSFGPSEQSDFYRTPTHNRSSLASFSRSSVRGPESAHKPSQPELPIGSVMDLSPVEFKQGASSYSRFSPATPRSAVRPYGGGAATTSILNSSSSADPHNNLIGGGGGGGSIYPGSALANVNSSSVPRGPAGGAPIASSSHEGMGSVSYGGGGGSNGMYASSGHTVPTTRWITVYGFDRGASDTVLQTFQDYGEIVRWELGAGNWLHIQYRLPHQAQLALHRNGTKLSPTVMVGVVECPDLPSDSVPLTHVPPSAQKLPARPYSIGVDQVRPQTSLWTKVTEYVFGW